LDVFLPQKIVIFLLQLYYRGQRSKCSSENGFTTWNKLYPSIQHHESSPAHRTAFIAWKELERGLNKGGLIDNHLQ
jgi:hypothetical protein